MQIVVVRLTVLHCALVSPTDRVRRNGLAEVTRDTVRANDVPFLAATPG